MDKWEVQVTILTLWIFSPLLSPCKLTTQIEWAWRESNPLDPIGQQIYSLPDLRSRLHTQNDFDGDIVTISI